MKSPKFDYENEITGSYHKRSYAVEIAIVIMIVLCGAIYYYTTKEAENPGCIASAHQATKNGFDLEVNLAVCNLNQ
jgi:hypothetical protein